MKPKVKVTVVGPDMKRELEMIARHKRIRVLGHSKHRVAFTIADCKWGAQQPGRSQSQLSHVVIVDFDSSLAPRSYCGTPDIRAYPLSSVKAKRRLLPGTSSITAATIEKRARMWANGRAGFPVWHIPSNRDSASHVFNNGTICWGTLEYDARTFFRNKQLVGLTMLMMSFLDTP